MSRQQILMTTRPLLADVGAPTVTPQGTGGAQTWSYQVVAVDAQGKKTATSSNGSTAVGNATIDGTNFNRVTWTDVATAVSYEIHRTVSGGTPASLGLIGTVLQGVQTFDDTGLVGDASSANASNTTGEGEILDCQLYNGTIDAVLDGTFTGTYQLQGRYSAQHAFINEGTALTAAGVLVVTAKYLQMRWLCTAFTSGTPAALASGDNH